MDRITQLQNEIQQLFVQMSRTVQYLTDKVDFLQISEDVPVTKKRKPEKVDPPEVFEANKKELVTDLIIKAKQIEFLITSLPQPEPEEEQAKRLQGLEQEMAAVNEEYKQAVERAKSLHSQINDMLSLMLTETNDDDNQPMISIDHQMEVVTS